MQLTEPMTMATDYALAIIAGFLALRIWKNSRDRNHICRKFWSGALAATAFAALIGGTSHGFAPYFNDFAKTVIWKTTVYSIGVVSLFMVVGFHLRHDYQSIKKNPDGCGGIAIPHLCRLDDQSQRL